MYLATLPAEVALHRLRRRLDDSSWRVAPEDWLTRLNDDAYRNGLVGSDEVVGLSDGFVEKLFECGVGREAHETVNRPSPRWSERAVTEGLMTA